MGRYTGYIIIIGILIHVVSHPTPATTGVEINQYQSSGNYILTYESVTDVHYILML